jgi:hypothetical protein
MPIKVYKEYEVKANLVIDTHLTDYKKLEEELIWALVDVVEKHDSFIGGGLSLEPYGQDEERQDTRQI